jgi:hypothetical protein
VGGRGKKLRERVECASMRCAKHGYGSDEIIYGEGRHNNGEVERLVEGIESDDIERVA